MPYSFVIFFFLPHMIQSFSMCYNLISVVDVPCLSSVGDRFVKSNSYFNIFNYVLFFLTHSLKRLFFKNFSFIQNKINKIVTTVNKNF